MNSSNDAHNIRVPKLCPCRANGYILCVNNIVSISLIFCKEHLRIQQNGPHNTAFQKTPVSQVAEKCYQGGLADDGKDASYKNRLTTIRMLLIRIG
jgi:hypothetical protein